jgi:hypothetical protein
MPWVEPSAKDQKLLFVADCLRGEESMTALCERSDGVRLGGAADRGAAGG